MSYTIVEPSFELFEPCIPSNHMEFLERCVRTCYKSEDHIKEGSAQVLMEKVVNKFRHHSVIEHCNVAVMISDGQMVQTILRLAPLFQLGMTSHSNNEAVISGNLRMWRQLFYSGLRGLPVTCEQSFCLLSQILHEQYPFFFKTYPEAKNNVKIMMEVLDTNPITNKHELSKELLYKHTTLTGKFIGSRTMSHQLVRHRLAAYSQESQRYCNYGKKGFQFIVPPTFSKEVTPDRPFPVSDAEMFCAGVQQAYEQYLAALDRGIPPEDARAILPNATKTEVVATYTLEMWKHVIEHRGHNPKAQWEIRDLCLSAEKQINEKLGWNI